MSSNRAGIGLDPCGALQLSLDLQPGETREICVVLGIGSSEAEACELAMRYVNPQQVEQAYQALGPTWDELCAITAHTPEQSAARLREA